MQLFCHLTCVDKRERLQMLGKDRRKHAGDNVSKTPEQWVRPLQSRFLRLLDVRPDLLPSRHERKYFET